MLPRVPMRGRDAKRDVTDLRSTRELIEVSSDEVKHIKDHIAGREDTPRLIGYVDYGIEWNSGVCQTEASVQDVAKYQAFVDNTACAAWMDNTTLVTAAALMSDAAPEVVTPLTVWDLATFARAVVCYDHIYHHTHDDVRDDVMNQLLGSDVLKKVPLPIRPVSPGRILPRPWDGAHRYLCDIWTDAYNWLKRLNEAVGRDTLDGKQLDAVTAAWRTALGRDDLQPAQLVDWQEVSHRWESPSDRLLMEIADVTGLQKTQVFLDLNESSVAVAQARREAGLPDVHAIFRSNILSDLNLRAYVNQRLAEFFSIPYACSAARSPFRHHLYDRWLAFQQELIAAKVLDDRYGELAKSAQLRLPIFLALALRHAKQPSDLWKNLADMRDRAFTFRLRRASLDEALARGDLKEAESMSKALHTSVEGVLELAGKATTAAGSVVFDNISKLDLEPAKTAVAAAVAASKGLIESSFAQRLMWRLQRPQLLWVNDMIDQAQYMTEAMPDFSRLWRIPPNRQGVFALRFQKMATLGVSGNNP